MKIELLHDTVVRFPAGAVLDVSEHEARRLLALNNAVLVTDKQPAKPAPKTRKPKKEG